MTYIEKKYQFEFPFDRYRKNLHLQEFGCCGYHELCTLEGYCIIPNSYGDGKIYCQLSKRNGWDEKGPVTLRIKKVRGKDNG